MTANMRPAVRALGICALIGALTTILNTMAPLFYEAEGFDEAAALIRHPVYAARQWVLLVHPAFTLLLALGLLLALFGRAPGRAASGFAFAFVEKMTEFVLGVLILFVVNGVWKEGYLTGDGPAPPAELKARIETFYDLLGGAYFLLWVMFVLSTGLFASCLGRSDWLSRIAIASAGATIVLTVMMILGRYAGQSSWTAPFIAYAYGPFLTLHRAAIGVWLIRESFRTDDDAPGS
ncbi:MAG: hypothetical protein ACFB00_06580 [Parvularculaceae bacterium]